MGNCVDKTKAAEVCPDTSIVPGVVEISRTRRSRSMKSTSKNTLKRTGTSQLIKIESSSSSGPKIQAAFIHSTSQVVELPIPDAVYNHPQFKESSSLWQFIQHQQTANHNASMAVINTNPPRCYISLVPLHILSEMLQLAAMQLGDCKALFAQSSLKQLTQTINVILPAVRGHWLVELLQRLKEVAFASANSGRISNARRVSVVYAGPEHSYSSAHLPNAFTLTWLKHGASMIHNGSLWTTELPSIRLTPLGTFQDKQIRLMGAVLHVDSNNNNNNTTKEEEQQVPPPTTTTTDEFAFYYFRIELLPVAYVRQTSNIDFTALKLSLQTEEIGNDGGKGAAADMTNEDEDDGTSSWRPTSPTSNNTAAKKILSIRVFLIQTLHFGPRLDEIFDKLLKDPTVSLSLLLQDMHFASDHFRVAAAEQATSKSSQRILLCLQRWMILCALQLLEQSTAAAANNAAAPAPPLKRSRTTEEKQAVALERSKRRKTDKIHG